MLARCTSSLDLHMLIVPYWYLFRTLLVPKVALGITPDLYHSFSASTHDRQCQCTMQPTSRTDGQFNFEYLYFAYPVCSQGPLSNTVTFKSGKTEKTLNVTSLVTRASLSELSTEDPTLELNLRFFGTACTSEGLVWFHFRECL